MDTTVGFLFRHDDFSRELADLVTMNKTWFLSHVNSQVFDQLTAKCKRLITLRTAVEFYPWMNSHMDLKEIGVGVKTRLRRSGNQYPAWWPATMWRLSWGHRCRAEMRFEAADGANLWAAFDLEREHAVGLRIFVGHLAQRLEGWNHSTSPNKHIKRRKQGRWHGGHCLRINERLRWWRRLGRPELLHEQLCWRSVAEKKKSERCTKYHFCRGDPRILLWSRSEAQENPCQVSWPIMTRQSRPKRVFKLAMIQPSYCSENGKQWFECAGYPAVDTWGPRKKLIEDRSP